jgi:hypothetical protein
LDVCMYNVILGCIANRRKMDPFNIFSVIYHLSQLRWLGVCFFASAYS